MSIEELGEGKEGISMRKGRDRKEGIGRKKGGNMEEEMKE